MVLDPTDPTSLRACYAGVPERRRDAKQRYQDYQQRAREQAETINRVLDREILQVEAYPQVHEVEDGAFVEAIIWVPREKD